MAVFYVDGCEAYRAAIADVFPQAVIQYDYFHVIQNIWRKLWKAVVARRKEIKAEAETTKTATPATATQLLGLAKRIWEHRYVFFKRDEHLTSTEQQVLPQLLEEKPFLGRVRGFVKDVWGLFQRDQTEQDAERKLVALKMQVAAEPRSPFAKSVAFLESRFSDMVSLLRHPTLARDPITSKIRCSPLPPGLLEEIRVAC